MIHNQIRKNNDDEPSQEMCFREIDGAVTAHRRGAHQDFKKLVNIFLKQLFYFGFYNPSKLQKARLMVYFLFVRISGHKGKKMWGFLC